LWPIASQNPELTHETTSNAEGPLPAIGDQLEPSHKKELEPDSEAARQNDVDPHDTDWMLPFVVALLDQPVPFQRFMSPLIDPVMQNVVETHETDLRLVIFPLSTTWGDDQVRPLNRTALSASTATQNVDDEQETSTRAKLLGPTR
jgi:hypothetical protein